MKYMTFNSSCSQAGLANLLEDYDIDIEDYELAEKMKLAYIFKYDGQRDGYLTGLSLQDKKYFDYYLNPRGLELMEKTLEREDLVDFLKDFKRRCMLGLDLGGQKHVLVFEGYDLAREDFVFLKMKGEDSPEEAYIRLDQEELARLVDRETAFSYISYKQGDYIVDLDEDIRASLDILERYAKEIGDYMGETRSLDSLDATMDSLFRPFLIDSYTMMDILGQEDLKGQIGSLRKSYLEAMSLKREVRLADYLPEEKYKKALEDYRDIIGREVENL